MTKVKFNNGNKLAFGNCFLEAKFKHRSKISKISNLSAFKKPNLKPRFCEIVVHYNAYLLNIASKPLTSASTDCRNVGDPLTDPRSEPILRTITSQH